MSSRSIASASANDVAVRKSLPTCAASPGPVASASARPAGGGQRIAGLMGLADESLLGGTELRSRSSPG